MFFSSCLQLKVPRFGLKPKKILKKEVPASFHVICKSVLLPSVPRCEQMANITLLLSADGGVRSWQHFSTPLYHGKDRIFPTQLHPPKLSFYSFLFVRALIFVGHIGSVARQHSRDPEGAMLNGLPVYCSSAG